MSKMDDLCRFLVDAKKATYASGDSAEEIKEKDKSTTMTYSDAKRLYHDNYFGGEPYGGREVVFFENKPLYIMTYYGWVDEQVKDVKGVYNFLQTALTLIPGKQPYRGPEKLVEGDRKYINSFEGEIDSFSGEEIIYYKGEEVYSAKYMGGLVDQR